MKLLFDENLSSQLVARLGSVYPNSQQAESVGLRAQSDLVLLEYAARHGFTLVSKDNDFRQLSFLHGQPPKVIWLNIGNASTDAVIELLSRQIERVRVFLTNPEESLLVLELELNNQN